MWEQSSVECVKKPSPHPFIVSITIFLFDEKFNLVVVDLSEPIDVYNSWIDACEEQNRE